MKTLLTSLALACFLSLPALSSEFLSKGGGGADFERPRPWFPSMGAVRQMQDIDVCIKSDPGFGVDEAGLRKAANDSFKIWADYIEYVRQNHGMSAPDYIDENFKLLSACDGSEDLTLYFGSQEGEVRQVSGAFSEPLAFAHKRALAPKKNYYGWSQGFIYLASPAEVESFTGAPKFSWAKNNDILESLLVHELGHVLGHSHVSGTIMDEDIAHQLFDSRYPHPPLIDQDRQLFVCYQACSIDYVAIPEELNGVNAGQQEFEGFTLLTGRKSVGVLQGSVHLDIGWSRSSYVPTGYLIYKDDTGSYKLPLELTTITNIYDAGDWVFGQKAVDPGMSYLGWITKLNGEKVQIYVNQNNGIGGVFELHAVKAGDEFGETLLNTNTKFRHLQYYGHE